MADLEAEARRLAKMVTTRAQQAKRGRGQTAPAQGFQVDTGPLIEVVPATLPTGRSVVAVSPILAKLRELADRARELSDDPLRERRAERWPSYDDDE